MAFGGFTRPGTPAPSAVINMVPLIDVMLVLLVIFIITAPLLTHAVKIDLPHAASSAALPHPDDIRLSLDAQGRAYWNGDAVTRDEWRARMRAAAGSEPQPELRLRADGALAYKNVVEVMADAAQAGLVRIGFVTDPREADDRHE